ncbi:MAG TPA: YecA family protein [Burkholderiaceae bacterium]|nr:YecA family protein [Burkholderiaceae bacterium]
MPRPAAAPPRPLSERERERLEALLDALPPPLEPLDVSALDGFLAGVLLQPRPVPASRWLAHVHDLEARPVPPGVRLDELHALVQRRHAELDRAIAQRRWFDPWVFELEPEARGAEVTPSDVVMPWVAGFAAALELFPDLLAQGGADVREPLAALYRHFDPDDLEDVEDLREPMDELGPPSSVEEAVEDLVSSTLLLADATRPLAARPPGKGRAR